MVHSYCVVFSITIFIHFLGSYGVYFNCDPVNQGHYCLCARGEAGVWDVQCPARILEVYPVSLKCKNLIGYLNFNGFNHIGVIKIKKPFYIS